jgi:hypothetical protein
VDPEPAALVELASRIEGERRALGITEPGPLVSRFSEYRSMRGGNVKGEPKLAQEFLEEIESSRSPK